MSDQEAANAAQARASVSQHEATGAQRDASDAQNRVSPTEHVEYETAKTQKWIRRLATITAMLVVLLGLVTSFYSIRGDVRAEDGRVAIKANTAYLISCTVPARTAYEKEQAKLGKRCYENSQKASSDGPVLAIINENDRRTCVRFQQAFGQLSDRGVVDPPLVFDCRPLALPPTTPPSP